MIRNNQKQLRLFEINWGIETEMVVKRQFASCEFAHLPVPVKHLRICPVCSSVGRGESSNRCQEAGRSLSRTIISCKEVT